MKTIEAIRQQVEIWKAFEGLSGEATIPPELAAAYLGISKKSLARLRQNGEGPPYIQVRAESETTARNQKVNYILEDLSIYRTSQKVGSTMEAAQLRGMTFATLSDLLEEQPFWIQTIHAESKGGMGRETVSKSREVIVGHVLTVSDPEFAKLLRDPDAEVKWMSLDDAMSLSWADEEARAPFHAAYVEVLQQSINRSNQQQEAATLRSIS